MMAPLRPVRLEEDTPRMSHPPSDASDAAARATVCRLVDLLQILVPRMRPGAMRAIERCVLELAIDEMRYRIGENLARLDADDLATVDALVATLTQPHAVHEEAEAP